VAGKVVGLVGLYKDQQCLGKGLVIVVLLTGHPCVKGKVFPLSTELYFSIFFFFSFLRMNKRFFGVWSFLLLSLISWFSLLET